MLRMSNNHQNHAVNMNPGILSQSMVIAQIEMVHFDHVHGSREISGFILLFGQNSQLHHGETI